ncbi:MAG TPA: hypothetical protein VL201_04145 [Patescibacteria group bacterium]|nr:hypothetical protein [Patescibacteria group bacterium]
MIKNVLFASIMICVKLSAMDDQKLVHPALLNPKIKFVQPKTYPPEASLADCLRDNHHVRVYEPLLQNLDKIQNVLEFTTYGEDALRWIIPKNPHEVDQKWDELKDALSILISKWNITKIMFRIQPEINRLQKVDRYSCLLDIDHISLAASVIKKLDIGNIKIEYIACNAFFKKKPYFLYRKDFKIPSSDCVIIDENVKIEILTDWDQAGEFLMIQNSETQKNVDKKENSRTFSYAVCGAGVCFMMWLGLYRYNKSKNVSLKRLF